MTIEIVDFPINSMVTFNSYVKLAEGILCINGLLVGGDWNIFFVTFPSYIGNGKIIIPTDELAYFSEG